MKHFNGREDLTTKLETFLTPQLLTSKAVVGIVVDANGNPSRTSTELSQLLSGISGQTVSVGTWSAGTPKIGLFVAPDGKSTGEIESLVWQAWAADPANAKPRQCIESYVGCMNAVGFKSQSPDKGLVSSLLAIRNDDDPRLGPGARTKRIFDFNRPQYSPLKIFLSGF